MGLVLFFRQWKPPFKAHFIISPLFPDFKGNRQVSEILCQKTCFLAIFPMYTSL